MSNNVHYFQSKNFKQIKSKTTLFLNKKSQDFQVLEALLPNLWPKVTRINLILLQINGLLAHGLEFPVIALW